MFLLFIRGFMTFPIPVMRALRNLGSDINNARRRRRITIALMAERSNLSRATIGKIEKGDPNTSMGGYASVLFVLGMTESLNQLVDAKNDLIGRRLEDEKLPKRVRIPKHIKRDDHA